MKYLKGMPSYIWTEHQILEGILDAFGTPKLSAS